MICGGELAQEIETNIYFRLLEPRIEQIINDTVCAERQNVRKIREVENKSEQIRYGREECKLKISRKELLRASFKYENTRETQQKDDQAIHHNHNDHPLLSLIIVF